MLNRKILTSLAFGVAMAVATPSLAQMPFSLIRGTIDMVEGNVMTLTTVEGEQLSITLNDGYIVGYNTALTLADLTVNTEIGVTTIDGPDGLPVPIEVHVMDESGNMNDEWDLPGDDVGLMTNGVITEATAAEGGQLITVHYISADGSREGDLTLLIPNETPVVRLMNESDPSLLVPGAYVFVVAVQGADGAWSTGYIQAEKDGVRPPL
ncbi:MAG: hypothetical protein KIS96_02870 [Bauldia sp.]|nr:hypothetical protein [Bauldia sp.]